MKPAWDKLGAEYKDSETVLIGDVDCTVEKDLCSTYGVRGYPTIKYFTGSTAATGDKYEGGRTFDDLKKFVETSLGPQCGSDNLELCDEEQRAKIEEYMKLSPDELSALIKEKTDAMEAAEQLFKDEVDKLQKAYKQLMEDKDATIESISPGLSLLRSVKLPKAEEGAAHDEL